MSDENNKWSIFDRAYQIINPPKPDKKEGNDTYWSFRWENNVWSNDLLYIVRNHQSNNEVHKLKARDAYDLTSILQEALKLALSEELGLDRWSFHVEPEATVLSEDSYQLEILSFNVIALREKSAYADEDAEDLLASKEPCMDTGSNVYVKVDLSDLPENKMKLIQDRIKEAVDSWEQSETEEFEFDEKEAKFKLRPPSAVKRARKLKKIQKKKNKNKT